MTNVGCACASYPRPEVSEEAGSKAGSGHSGAGGSITHSLRTEAALAFTVSISNVVRAGASVPGFYQLFIFNTDRRGWKALLNQAA